MNVLELWFGINPKFNQIIKQLDRIEKALPGVGGVKHELDEIRSDLADVKTALTTMQAQLDRIEQQVSPSEAATLVVMVGEPFEQS